MKHSISTFIRLPDTDASGRIFYASLFRFTSECFEDFLREAGLPLEQWINGPLPALPVRKVEAEYFSALPVGAPIIINLVGATAGSTSATLSFTVTNPDASAIYASATIVHVAVDHSTGQPTALPNAFKDALGKIA
jgi:acyl-CoA thioesterase FadM